MEITRKKQRTLNENCDRCEQESFFKLVKEEETVRLLRIKLLGELGQLRGVSLPEIAADLGIKAPNHAD